MRGLNYSLFDWHDYVHKNNPTNWTPAMKPNAIVAVLAASFLSACIGNPAVTLTPTGTVPVVNATGLASDPFAAFSMDVNQYRAAAVLDPAPALNPLTYNSLLQGAAQTHANDMSANDFFSHTGSDGKSVADRVTAQGYNGTTVMENIAMGQTSASAALDGWQKSYDHNQAILSSVPTEFALAWAPGNYWVMVLAKPAP